MYRLGLGLPPLPSGGLPPLAPPADYHSLYVDSIAAAQQHDLIARVEAQRAADLQRLDMQRMAESQRMAETQRMADTQRMQETRRIGDQRLHDARRMGADMDARRMAPDQRPTSFLTPYSKDGPTPGISAPHTSFPDHLLEREMRERQSSLSSSAFSLSQLYPGLPGDSGLPRGDPRSINYPPSLRPPVSSPIVLPPGPYPPGLSRPQTSPGSYGCADSIPPGYARPVDATPPGYGRPVDIIPPGYGRSSDTSPSGYGRKDVSPSTYGLPATSPGSGYPVHRSRVESPSRPPISHPAYSPRSRSSSPFLSPAPLNNSSLSDKLKMGFGGFGLSDQRDVKPVISQHQQRDFVKPVISQHQQLDHVKPVISQNQQTDYVKPVMSQHQQSDFVKPVISQHQPQNFSQIKFEPLSLQDKSKPSEMAAVSKPPEGSLERLGAMASVPGSSSTGSLRPFAPPIRTMASSPSQLLVTTSNVLSTSSTSSVVSPGNRISSTWKPSGLPESWLNLPDSRTHHPDSRTHHPDSRIHPADSRIHPTDSRINPPDPRIHPPDSRIHPPDSRIHPPDSRIHPPDPRIHPPDSRIHPPDPRIHPQDARIHPPDSRLLPPDSRTHLQDARLHHPDSKLHPSDSRARSPDRQTYPPDSRSQPLVSRIHPLDYRSSKPETGYNSPDEVEVLEVEEEVLVDDFDGQCCRTYPLNHSRIQRWRETKANKDREKRKKENEEKEVAEKEAAKRLAANSVTRNIRIPTTTEKSKDSAKYNEPLTTTAGSIPVGIVSARQRQQEESSVVSRAQVPEHERRELAAMPLPPSGPLVSGMAITNSGAMGPSTWSSGPPPPWVLSGHAPPPGASPFPSSTPWGLPPGHPPGHLSMGGPQPGGPIPMGYQLAKDPMTGQILLIPTDPTQRPPGLYSGFEGPPPGMSLTPGMPPSSTASQHLHHLMLQQQHLQYMQHQDLLHHQMRQSAVAAAQASSLPPSKPKVPETITVSDDDDEAEVNKQKDIEKPQQTQIKVVNSDIEKPKSPPRVEIKTEIVKQELKREVIDADLSSTEILNKPDEPQSTTIPAINECPQIKTEVSIRIKEEKEFLQVEDDITFGSASNECDSSIVAVDQQLQQNNSITQAEDSELDITEDAQLDIAEDASLDIAEEAQLDIEEDKQLDIVKSTQLDISEGMQVEIKKEMISQEENDNKFPSEESRLCAETLLSMSNFFAQPSMETDVDSQEKCQPSGFEILFEGIELLAKQNLEISDLSPMQTLTALCGLDLLCAVTEGDMGEWGAGRSQMDIDKLDIDLLCACTEQDYQDHLNWVDPIVLLKRQINVKKYVSEATEKDAKEFISLKIKQYQKDNPESLEEAKYDGIKALAKMIKKIKNMEIMSQLEVDLRLKITELQNNYREKQKSLTKLKTPRKRNMKKKLSKRRGPGRPKKRKLPNPKPKMGRPRKHLKVTPTSVSPTTDMELDVENTDEKLDIIEPTNFLHSEAPPILEPQKQTETQEPITSPSSGSASRLLKPPRLTASSPPPPNTESSRNTSLSILTSKFMKGKESPFANLLSKLAGGVTGGSADAQRNLEATGEGNDSGDLEPSASSSEKSSDESSSETGSILSPTRDSNFQFGHSSFGDPLSSPTAEPFRNSKKRKGGKPKKHSGGTSEMETIVHKKPKNLFMMMDFQRGFNTKAAEDEYNFDEDDNEMENPKQMFNEYRDPTKDTSNNDKQVKKERKDSIDDGYCKDPQDEEFRKESSDTEYRKDLNMETDEFAQDNPRKKHKRKKSKLSRQKNSKKECSSSRRSSEEADYSVRTSQLKAQDLKDGLRILMLQDGKFWPSRLNSTKLPDVYGVVLDRQRGNRPIILPRDDILKEAVLEVRAGAHLPVGARVCCYWSSAYNCLFPGTVTQPDEPLPQSQVLVELDDGDSRLVEVSKIRMLPPDYSRVVYDPDPIASLRRRRISTDSHDSGASHGDHRPSSVASNPHQNNQPGQEPHPGQSGQAEGAEQTDGETSRKQQKLSDPSVSSETAPKQKSKSDGLKTKKKHKKYHGHHHCHKQKHKKHKSNDGNKTKKNSYQEKFAIRSPPHGNKEARARSEGTEDDADSSDEASQEESEAGENTTDEESQDRKPHRPTHQDLTPGKGRELWQWVGEGYKRPGGKGKSKKVFHRSIQRGKDTLHVNDCAVFLSTGRSDRPYIGRLEMLWETSAGNMMVKVKWFYHPQEIETCGRKFDLKLPGGLFQSPHTDENSVHTISHQCQVLPFKEYSRFLGSAAGGTMYYLAGSYDPAGLTVHFQPGVLKSTDSD